MSRNFQHDSGNMQGLKVSVVVPVYNGAETLTELFERIRKVFNQLSMQFQVVFVEDCGRDNSWEVIRTLKAQYPAEITAIKLNRNFGQHNATMCGLEHADGDVMVTIDDVLQIFPEDIPLLVTLPLENGAERVHGIYV